MNHAWFLFWFLFAPVTVSCLLDGTGHEFWNSRNEAPIYHLVIIFLLASQSHRAEPLLETSSRLKNEHQVQDSDSWPERGGIANGWFGHEPQILTRPLSDIADKDAPFWRPGAKSRGSLSGHGVPESSKINGGAARKHQGDIGKEGEGGKGPSTWPTARGGGEGRCQIAPQARI